MEETEEQAYARNCLTPETLSAALLVRNNLLGESPVTDVVLELMRQTTAINNGDTTRTENMLVAQAHTLGVLFAQPASRALRTRHMDGLQS